MRFRKKLVWNLVSGAAMIAMMIVIFSFSGQSGTSSSQQSDGVGAFILNLLGIEIPEGQSPSTVPIIGIFNIRNCAHIFLYMMLGITCFLFVASLFAYKKGSGCWAVLLIAVCGLGISVLYACFDELHQMFSDGRTARWFDIGIDTMGASISTAVCAGIYFCVKLVKGKKTA